MKKPHFSLLLCITFVVSAFTLGLCFGRNVSGPEISVSIMPTVPEEQAEPQQISYLIDINTAPASLLATLPGIGDGLAAKIIAYREENGAFTHVEQLLNVPGIGEKRLEALIDMITTGGNP